MDNITPIFKSPGLTESFGTRLREARIGRGLANTELAERVGITAQAISQYELGKTTPRGDVFARICAVLNMPPSFFVAISSESEPPEGPIFFRSLKSSTQKSQDMMHVRAKWSWRLFAYFDQFITFPEVKIFEPDRLREPGQWTLAEISEIANETRKFWGLGLGPISNVTALVETNGIVVSRAHVGDVKLDAFSHWRGKRPLMFLSSDKESAVRSRFDAAHELGHLILHPHIDLSGTKDSRSRRKILDMIEKEANMFASAFLLPEETFCKEIFSSSLNHFVTLKQRWKVSIAAMIYRCESLGILSENQSLYLRKQMAAKKMRTVEPLDNELPIEQPALLSTAVKMLIDNGVQRPRDISEAVKLPFDDVENLCNLTRGSLRAEDEKSNVVSVQFRSET